MTAQAALTVSKRGVQIRLHKANGVVDTRGFLDRIDEEVENEDAVSYEPRWQITVNQADAFGLRRMDRVDAGNRSLRVRSILSDDTHATVVLDDG